MSTEPIRPLASTPAGSAARLSAGLHFKGEISGNDDLQVDGGMEGSIQLEGRQLTVGTSGKVTADIVAREVVVYGSVKGNLRARDRIEIKKGGSLVSDLTTAHIMAEGGDGGMEGSIQLEGRKLTVGTSAKVTADIVAREVVVYGSIKGNLRARDRIEIKKGGSVVGDLTTAQIMVEDGAYFKGLIEIDRKVSEAGTEIEKPAHVGAATPTAHMTAAKSA